MISAGEVYICVFVTELMLYPGTLPRKLYALSPESYYVYGVCVVCGVLFACDVVFLCVYLNMGAIHVKSSNMIDSGVVVESSARMRFLLYILLIVVALASVSIVRAHVHGTYIDGERVSWEKYSGCVESIDDVCDEVSQKINNASRSLTGLNANLGEDAMPWWLGRLLNSDQPGRLLAVFVFAPTLFYKSIQYDDKFIKLFAVSLFVWDLYWLLVLPARVTGVNI